jgi:hypothetical protein
VLGDFGLAFCYWGSHWVPALACGCGAMCGWSNLLGLAFHTDRSRHFLLALHFYSEHSLSFWCDVCGVNRWCLQILGFSCWAEFSEHVELMRSADGFQGIDP